MGVVVNNGNLKWRWQWVWWWAMVAMVAMERGSVWVHGGSDTMLFRCRTGGTFVVTVVNDILWCVVVAALNV